MLVLVSLLYYIILYYIILYYIILYYCEKLITSVQMLYYMLCFSLIAHLLWPLTLQNPAYSACV